MRSLMIATALCAVLTLTGCSFTISGPCTTLSHQSRMAGECGCSTDGGCDSCTPGAMMSSWSEQPECPPANFGEGMPSGMEGISMPFGGILGRLGSKGSPCGCDEQVPCGDECSGGESYVSNNDGLGMGLFQKGQMCDDGGGPGLLGRRPQLAGRAMGAIASHGCGRLGCGSNGSLCMSCRAKLSRLFGPYRGQIPHVQQPQGPGGPGMAPSYVYPYYTTRGPRDFLMANPPSIGY